MPLYTAQNFILQSGVTVPELQIAYTIYGQLNSRRDNLVVFPTYFTGRQHSNEPYFGAGRALDPKLYCILVPCMIGNAVSSSPSNTSGLFGGANFPHVTIHDNVKLQRALIEAICPVDHAALIIGWSMGGCQAFEWAVQYSDFVERALPFCATAKCSPHNHVFLEGVKAALTADENWADGKYATPPERGLRAFGRAYAGWAYSSAYFDEGAFRSEGFGNIEALLTYWENNHLTWDANDLLCKLGTWQNADVSANECFRGNLTAALKSIQAKMIVMPSSTDMYFNAANSKLETASIPNAEFRPFESIWGHCAATPSAPDPQFPAFFDQTITDLLCQ